MVGLSLSVELHNGARPATAGHIGR